MHGSGRAPHSGQLRAGNLRDLSPRQHFDIWTFAHIADKSGFFGKLPPQVVENLLWFFIEAGDIVIDRRGRRRQVRVA